MCSSLWAILFTTAFLSWILAIGYQWDSKLFCWTLKSIPLINLFLAQMMLSCCDLCQISWSLLLQPSRSALATLTKQGCSVSFLQRCQYCLIQGKTSCVEIRLPQGQCGLLYLPPIPIQELPFLLCYTVNSPGHDRLPLYLCSGQSIDQNL